MHLICHVVVSIYQKKRQRDVVDWRGDSQGKVQLKFQVVYYPLRVKALRYRLKDKLPQQQKKRHEFIYERVKLKIQLKSRIFMLNINEKWINRREKRDFANDIHPWVEFQMHLTHIIHVESHKTCSRAYLMHIFLCRLHIWKLVYISIVCQVSWCDITDSLKLAER